jgi:hypothetical protein
MTLTDPSPTNRFTAQRSRTADSDTMRRRALERLYQRKTVLDNLIECLERYEECRAIRPTSGISVTEMRKCS